MHIRPSITKKELASCVTLCILKCVNYIHTYMVHIILLHTPWLGSRLDAGCSMSLESRMRHALRAHWTIASFFFPLTLSSTTSISPPPPPPLSIGRLRERDRWLGGCNWVRGFRCTLVSYSSWTMYSTCM